MAESQFSEDSRVKYPAIVHIVSMGYDYISSNSSSKPKGEQEPYDNQTNILTDKFAEAYKKLNPSDSDRDLNNKLSEIQSFLDYDDLGKRFYYEIFLNQGNGKIIDVSSYENFVRNNTFQVATEMTCGDLRGDNFRPDITLFINGLPLAFIEVKKHNNHTGITAETERMKVRFQTRSFRRYINITQIMVFSNDMEYDDDSVRPVQGAFYATTGKRDTKYNCFREQGQDSFPIQQKFRKVSDDEIFEILKDQNKQSFRSADWFETALTQDCPTKRMINCLFSFERFFFLLKYGIAYVDADNGLQKHIMRYPQLFATKAIERHLETGNNCGVIWHTQGSGKTALAYYNVKYLTDYYSKKGIIPQFFFIVDRLDLLIQAQEEFAHRGLFVNTVDSKDDFKHFISDPSTVHNDEGKTEITVVNIQKFSNDSRAVAKNDYNLDIKRIYFIDEAHRDYNPQGCFLKNLIASDRNSVRIALTGTPIITKDFNTKDIFGDYINIYYYNASIADGYTLRLMREQIESNFKIRMQEILNQIRVKEHQVKKDDIYSHPNFVNPLLDYIVNDIRSFRAKGDDFKNVGGMMVCSSSSQARVMFQLFMEKYADPSERKIVTDEYGNESFEPVAADIIEDKPRDKKYLRAAIILSDVYDKEERKRWIKLFKNGKIDLLLVYQMLQTGFDAPRLKKLYLNRVAKDHNLLQTLTRVNRPYLGLRYGHVVDFADIETAYKKANEDYLHEIEDETGENAGSYSVGFISTEEAIARMQKASEILKDYDIDNPALFTREIDMIEDKQFMLNILHALEDVRDLENMLVSQGADSEKIITIKEVSNLLKATRHRIDMINFVQGSESKENISELLNQALENISFSFYKNSEEELVLQEQFKETLKHTRIQLGYCIDKDDPKYVTLLEEFQRILRKNEMHEDVEDFNMVDRVAHLKDILKRMKLLNDRDSILATKYRNDKKFARVQKRLEEAEKLESEQNTGEHSFSWTKNEQKMNLVLLAIKDQTDLIFLSNKDLINNPEYFTDYIKSKVTSTFNQNAVVSNRSSRTYLSNLISKEYRTECNNN